MINEIRATAFKTELQNAVSNLKISQTAEELFIAVPDWEEKLVLFSTRSPELSPLEVLPIRAHHLHQLTGYASWLEIFGRNNSWTNALIFATISILQKPSGNWVTEEYEYYGHDLSAWVEAAQIRATLIWRGLHAHSIELSGEIDSLCQGCKIINPRTKVGPHCDGGEDQRDLPILNELVRLKGIAENSHLIPAFHQSVLQYQNDMNSLDNAYIKAIKGFRSALVELVGGEFGNESRNVVNCIVMIAALSSLGKNTKVKNDELTHYFDLVVKLVIGKDYDFSTLRRSEYGYIVSLMMIFIRQRQAFASWINGIVEELAPTYSVKEMSDTPSVLLKKSFFSSKVFSFLYSWLSEVHTVSQRNLTSDLSES